MSAAMQRVFDRILGGDATALDGFGFLRATSTGPETSSGVRKFEDRLEIAGDGTVRLMLRRSLSDMPGRNAGLFETKKGPEVVLDLVRRLKAQPFDGLPASRVEPHDVAIRLVVVAGGAVAEYVFSARDREAASALQPVLNDLVPLVGEAEQHPTMTLGVTLAAATSARASATRIDLSLVLRNAGTRGYWLTHPSKLSDPEDRCELLFGLIPEVRQDSMPPPLEIFRAPVVVKDTAASDVLWMLPRSEIALACSTELLFPGSGVYFMRTGYCSYGGGVTIASQPHFIGGTFSHDIEVTVA